MVKEIQVTAFFITYAPIITLFLGAIIGFLFSIWKDNISENRKNKKEKKELKLKRLEELFSDISKMNKSCLNTYSTLLSNKDVEDTNYIDKVSFIIRSFFPNLEKEYVEYVELYFNFKQLQINAYSKKIENKQFSILEIEEWEKKPKEFMLKGTSLLSLVVSEARKV